MIRVLQVYKDLFPPTAGGVERNVAEVSRALAGHAKVQVLISSGRLRATREQRDGVEVFGAPELGRALSVPFNPTFPLWLRRLKADIYHLPFARPFDFAFSIGVLHHLPDWRGGLAEIARVLKPGGFYFLEEYYPALYQNFLTRHLFRHPETDRFERGDLRRGLKDAGFSLVRCLEE